MMASRGMGAMNPKKMPGKKEITRTDDPNKVAMYKRGGAVKKMADGELVSEPKIKPTDVVLDKDYKRIGAEISSGDIPVGDKGKASFNANASLSAAKGEKAKGTIDRLNAAYEHNFDKNTKLAANLGFGPKGDKSGMLTLTKNFDEGGKVNAAGNYTKPEMRKRIVAQVKAAATQGTGAGQWSARKAQLVAKKYKAAGGGYRD